MNRITMHVNTMELGNRELFEEYLAKTTSDYLYLMHYHEPYLNVALQRNKKVVMRIFDPFNDWNKGNLTFDNQYHRLHTPEKTIQYMNANFTKWKGNKNIYWIVGYNEPQYDDLQSQLDWFIKFGQLAIQNGYKVALGGWNTPKSIKALGDGSCPDIDNGVWDKLLKFSHENRENIILDFHDYTVGRAWADRTEGFPDSLLDRNKMNAKPAPTIWNSKNINGQWHIPRHAPLYFRGKQLGYNVRYGIGECVWDTVSDIDRVIKVLSERYGDPAFRKEIKGIVSLSNYYKFLSGKDVYSDTDFCNDAMKDMIWMDEEYPDEFEYFSIFAYNRNRYWDTCDLSNPRMSHFVKSIMNYTKVLKPTNPDTPTLPVYPVLSLTDTRWKKAQIKPLGDSINLRQYPSTTNSNILLKLTSKLEGYILIEAVYNDGQYRWYPFLIDTKIVWGRDDVVSYEYIVTPPPKPDTMSDLAFKITGGDVSKGISYLIAASRFIQEINSEVKYEVVSKNMVNKFIEIPLETGATINIDDSQREFLASMLLYLSNYIKNYPDKKE